MKTNLKKFEINNIIIQDKIGIPAKQQRLIMWRKELYNRKTTSEYKLTKVQ